MSKRERTLAWGFGGAAIVFAMILFATTGKNWITGLFSENERLRERAAELRYLIDHHDSWADRDAWLDEKVPHFASRQEASSALLEAVEALASTSRGESEQASVILKSRQLTEPTNATGIGEGDSDDSNAYFDATTVKMEIEAPEAALYQWIHRLHAPDTFRGITALNLERIESGTNDQSDKGTLRAEVELTQFYLP